MRITKVEKARSIKDIFRLLNDIKKSIKKNKKDIRNLFSSVSTTKLNIFVSNNTGKKVDTTIELGDIKQPVPRRRRPKVNSFKVERTKFKPPKIEDIRKNFKQIEELDENYQELQMAKSLIFQNFNSVPSKEAALKEIDTLSKEVKSILEVAYAALHKIASNHIPTELQEVVNIVVKHIVSKLEPNTYSKISGFVYVGEDKRKGGGIIFNYYINLEDLKTSDGFIYKDYYIVVSTHVDKNGLHSMYITSIPEFQPPATFPYGAPIKDVKDAKEAVNIILTRDNMLTHLGRKHIPLTNTKLKRSGINTLPGVVKSRMLRGSLFVILEPDVSRDEINSIITEIHSRVKSMLGGMVKSGITKKDVLLPKIRKTRKGNKAIQFILLPSKVANTSSSITQADLDTLLEGTNFDTTQLDELKQALLRIGYRVDT